MNVIETRNGSAMSAPDFCYRHFGRHFAPEARDAWASQSFFLRRKKGGVVGTPTRLAAAGIAAVITKEKVVLAGVHPPTDFSPEIEVVCSGLSPNALQMQTLFDPPKDEWVGVTFSNRGLAPTGLYLNATAKEVRFSENSGGSYVHIRLDLFKRAADLWGDTPIGKIYDARDDFMDRVANKESLFDIPPSAREAMAVLFGQDVGLFRRFLEWRKGNV